MRLNSGGLDDLCDNLCARLPELEWGLSQLGLKFQAKLLPRGLFVCAMELNAQNCIYEIKNDVLVLSQQKQRQRAVYLADRIHQKIEVLVRLCNLQRKKSVAINPAAIFTLDALSTRQQWLSSMQAQVCSLTEQQAAMKQANKILSRSNESILRMDAELGDVTRKLTIAQEALSRAESI